MPLSTDSALTEITALLDDVAAGISERDPDRCVARFTPDARSVIATGARAAGREAIRAAHVTAFAAGGPPRTARFVVLDLHLPRPDLALVTTGAYAAAPDEVVDLDHPTSVVTWTLLHDDGWWVAARQFTPVAG